MVLGWMGLINCIKICVRQGLDVSWDLCSHLYSHLKRLLCPLFCSPCATRGSTDRLMCHTFLPLGFIYYSGTTIPATQQGDCFTNSLGKGGNVKNRPKIVYFLRFHLFRENL